MSALDLETLLCFEILPYIFTCTQIDADHQLAGIVVFEDTNEILFVHEFSMKIGSDSVHQEFVAKGAVGRHMFLNLGDFAPQTLRTFFAHSKISSGR